MEGSVGSWLVRIVPSICLIERAESEGLRDLGKLGDNLKLRVEGGMFGSFPVTTR